MKIAISILLSIMSTLCLANIFQVDTKESSILWKAGKKTGSFHNGAINIKSGTIKTDKKGQISFAEVVVDMKSISNNDLKDTPEYQAKLIGHLSGDDFFKVNTFPEAKFEFVSLTLKAGSKNEYSVKGNLTIVGNKQPIEFIAQVSNDKTKIDGHAVLQIERLNWGLQYGSGSIFKTLTADKIINDTFELTINLVAKK